MKFFRNNKVYVFLMASLLVCLLAGCGKSLASGDSSASQETGDASRIRVVTVIYPEYDWVTELVGDRADLFQITCLTASGVDIHSYQPSVGDMAAINESDLFLYVGGESDSWAADAAANLPESSHRTIGIMGLLGDSLKEEELVEGMEEEEEEGEEGEDEPEYDEHVWLSLSNAKVFVTVIADALKELDPQGAEVYEANLQTYLSKLDALDQSYREVVESAGKDTLLFGDRFPFRYLVDDYGLNYYAAFAGCSAETEASFETIVFLADKLDELDLGYVLVIENSDESLARTIIDSSSDPDRQIAVLDSLQSVSADRIASGATYLSLMEENLQVLEKVLN